ncbi:hypothetical protein NECID01_0936 [Nematocida sp. AWRm77]|nr:hypothetical protein NECID01_0936 [Nematocida sp. AWRm77]
MKYLLVRAQMINSHRKICSVSLNLCTRAKRLFEKSFLQRRGFKEIRYVLMRSIQKHPVYAACAHTLLTSFCVDQVFFYLNNTSFIYPREAHEFAKIWSTVLVWASVLALCHVFGKERHAQRIQTLHALLNTLSIFSSVLCYVITISFVFKKALPQQRYRFFLFLLGMQHSVAFSCISLSSLPCMKPAELTSTVYVSLGVYIAGTTLDWLVHQDSPHLLSWAEG